MLRIRATEELDCGRHFERSRFWIALLKKKRYQELDAGEGKKAYRWLKTYLLALKVKEEGVRQALEMFQPEGDERLEWNIIGPTHCGVDIVGRISINSKTANK